MKKYIALLAFITLSMGLRAQQSATKMSAADSLLNAMNGTEKPEPV
jgi:hypothetical protein